MRISTLTIGENRKQPRIWIEGKYLGNAGFTKGQQVSIEWKEGEVIIKPAAGGNRKVSERRGSQILDLNCKEINEAFNGVEKVTVETVAGKISITPSKSQAKRKRRLERKGALTAGSVFAGGGLLDEAAKQAGFETQFGIEVDARYAEIWQENHKGLMINSCVSEVELERLPEVDLLLGGVPCEPFSKCRRQSGNKKRSSTGASDHELFDMSFWFLQIVDRCNPRVIVLEEVADYVESEVGQMVIKVLERMEYKVEVKTIDGSKYGAATFRKRTVIVAVSDCEITWPAESDVAQKVGELLHDPSDERCEWFDIAGHWLEADWAKKAEKKAADKGHNLQSIKLTETTETVQAITKRYFNGQGGNPVVKHPTREGVYRWLTVDEVRAIMQLPKSYELGPFKTIAGNVLGQGVLVDVFRQVIENVAA